MRQVLDDAARDAGCGVQASREDGSMTAVLRRPISSRAAFLGRSPAALRDNQAYTELNWMVLPANF